MSLPLCPCHGGGSRLGRRLENPRIVQAAEPYPGRWTHHVLLEKPEDVDEELMDWLDLAYGFAMTK